MNRTLMPDLDPGPSGALLQRLLEIADDAIIVTDEDHRIVLFNEGAERIFARSAADVLGEPLDLLLPEDVRAAHPDHMRAFGASAHVARRMGLRRDIHGLRADGRLFDAEASISHVEIGGRTYFTAILRDVTDARRAQRALADSEARFRGLAEAAPVGIFQAGPDGALVFVNDRWAQIAGMKAHAAMGEGWLSAVHPADRDRVRRAWHDALRVDGRMDLRFRFLRPDGSEVWVIGNASAAGSDADSAPGLIGTVTDVTDSHRQGLALERAKSEAEAAARAKSLFLANMSHEIRTPLNAVIGMTTLLQDTPVSDDQRDFVATIRASSESLLEIINNILDYSKADVGKLEIEQRPFDLRACIEDSLDMVAPRALEKGLNLAYLIEDGTPESLVGDAARIRQILVNLLSNAVKFTHQGEVLVTADSQPVGDEQVRLRLSVRDTGIGIAAQDLPRLFQSFTQVDASTTRRYGGTGLGLAICRRLAELMGGRMRVHSAPGEGSEFCAEVIVRPVQASVPAVHLRPDAPALLGKRILIVDDNLTNRRILTKLTTRWGMVPSTLPSALEALDRLRDGEAFDLALLDMSMPSFDGMDLAREIRRRLGPRELPIVLLTSLGQRHALEAGASLHLAACLAKPIKASVLFSTLVAALSGATLQAPVAAGRSARTLAMRLPLRLLVAEDNTVNQRVMLKLLHHLGYRADVASDGQQALDAVRRNDYDVVLMDIQMPTLDGVEAARAIVKQRGPEGLPRLVAMTANAMPGDREAYIAAGMDGYLPKPIELRELVRTLTDVAVLVRGTIAEPGSDVLDARRLEHLHGLQDDSQPGLVRELIDMFCADAADHVQRLIETHARGDAGTLRAMAHRFLSATENIGAIRLSGLCADIEQLARAGDLDAAAPLLAALGAERERTVAALGVLRMRY